VVNPDDLLDWYSTPLGMTAFLAKVRRMVSQEEYELMLRWASREGQPLTEAEHEKVQVLLDRIRGELLGRLGVEARGAERYAAGRGEGHFD
jgi:hypothetical protein